MNRPHIAASAADGKPSAVDDDVAPGNALPWSAAAERRAWRRAALSKFNGSGNAASIICVLMGLINAKHGYAHPSNGYLARETGLAANKMRAALLALEQGGAIIRVTRMIDGHKQRCIYPAKTILPTALFRGMSGCPVSERPVSGHQLRKRLPPPKSTLDAARQAARLREGGGGSARDMLDAIPAPQPVPTAGTGVRPEEAADDQSSLRGLRITSTVVGGRP